MGDISDYYRMQELKMHMYPPKPKRVMKTILVVFGKSEKRYSFNTKIDVKAGQVLNVKGYKTPIIVKKINPQVSKYFVYQTGELTNVSGSDRGKIKVITEEMLE